MPIEIRELHIKAVIDNASSKPGDAGEAGANKQNADTAAGDAEEMINLCVEKVMEILKEKEER